MVKRIMVKVSERLIISRISVGSAAKTQKHTKQNLSQTEDTKGLQTEDTKGLCQRKRRICDALTMCLCISTIYNPRINIYN